MENDKNIRILLSTWNIGDEDQIREFRECNAQIENEFSDNGIIDLLWDSFKENDWPMMLENINDACPNGWVIDGSVGRWNGRFGTAEFGFTKDELEDFFYKGNYEEIEIRQERAGNKWRLIVICSHHDGRNVFEIRALTEKGSEYIDRNQFDKSDVDIAEQLTKKNYSVIPIIKL